MYLHIGEETVVLLRDIITILDIETATTEKITREFLKQAEKNLIITAVGNELPKSVIVCSDAYGQRVYLSQIASKTLKKRAKFISK